MKEKQCMNSQNQSSFWRSVRQFCSALIVLPIALTLLLVRKILGLMTLRLRRPMVKEPIQFIALETMENEDLDDQQKKSDELGPHLRNLINSLDDPISLQNARWILEYNFHYKNQQNNEQNKLTQFPDIPYDDAIQ